MSKKSKKTRSPRKSFQRKPLERSFPSSYQLPSGLRDRISVALVNRFPADGERANVDEIIRLACDAGSESALSPDAHFIEVLHEFLSAVPTSVLDRIPASEIVQAYERGLNMSGRVQLVRPMCEKDRERIRQVLREKFASSTPTMREALEAYQELDPPVPDVAEPSEADFIRDLFLCLPPEIRPQLPDAAIHDAFNKTAAPVGVEVQPDGSRLLHVTPEMNALLEAQRQRFVAKFGREPTDDDPIFFDEDADTPQPVSESAYAEEWEALLQLVEAAGAPPAVMHAMRRTERIITSPRWFVMPGMPVNEHNMTPEEIREWEAAMREWHNWQERADKAAAEGEHPAFVEAIRKTGLRIPKPDEFTMTKTGVTASGDSADWFDLIHRYQVEHPDEHQVVADRLGVLLQRASGLS